jgi:hypothetical protein
MERCGECGFAYDLDALRPLDRLLREAVPPYRDALSAPVDSLRRRAAPDEWTPLEYAGHVRDILFVQRERVVLALVEDVPTFVPMHRDERVPFVGDNDREPADLAEELAVGAGLLAALFAGLDDEQLERTGVYNYPSPQPRTVRWIGVHTLHELHHHLADIRFGVKRSP